MQHIIKLSLQEGYRLFNAFYYHKKYRNTLYNTKLFLCIYNGLNNILDTENCHYICIELNKVEFYLFYLMIKDINGYSCNSLIHSIYSELQNIDLEIEYNIKLKGFLQ